MTYIKVEGNGGAPNTAKFITQEPHPNLGSEQALNALADGILKHAAGVVDVAVEGVDFAEVGHVHAQSDVTGLVAALAGKADSGHTHPDPWTYLVLGSDFPTSSNSAVDVTGMAFTPLANTRYEVEAVLMLRTATTTVGPRPGCAWPTGLTDGVATILLTSSATANVIANGNITAAVLAPVGGLPNTTASFPARMNVLFQAGASPSGTWRLQLASETAGTSVTLKAGSIVKYRTY